MAGHENILTVGGAAGFQQSELGDTTTQALDGDTTQQKRNILAPENITTAKNLSPFTLANAPGNINVGINDPIVQKQNVLATKTLVNTTVSPEGATAASLIQQPKERQSRFIDTFGNIINQEGKVDLTAGPSIKDPIKVFTPGQTVPDDVPAPGEDTLTDFTNKFTSPLGLMGMKIEGFGQTGRVIRAISAVDPTLDPTLILKNRLTSRSEKYSNFVSRNNLSVRNTTVSSDVTTEADPQTGENNESLLSAIVDSFPKNTEQVSARRNIESMLNDLMENTVLNFMDLSQLQPEAQELVRQQMTGETEATRAMRAKEASAMADGISNLMNNLSAQAGAAGITGGELRRLQEFGIAKIAESMGDFAMNNIIRMAETQQQGFNNFLNLMQMSAQSVSSVLNDISQLQQLDIQQKQFDNNTMDRMITLCETNPVACQIRQGWELYRGSVQGASVAGYLNTLNDKNVQAVIEDAQRGAYDIADIIKTQSFYESLNLPFVIQQQLDSNGKPMFDDKNNPILTILPQTNLNFDGNNWRVLATEELPEPTVLETEKERAAREQKEELIRKAKAEERGEEGGFDITDIAFGAAGLLLKQL